MRQVQCKHIDHLERIQNIRSKLDTVHRLASYPSSKAENHEIGQWCSLCRGNDANIKSRHTINTRYTSYHTQPEQGDNVQPALRTNRTKHTNKLGTPVYRQFGRPTAAISGPVSQGWLHRLPSTYTYVLRKSTVFTLDYPHEQYC